MEEIGHKRLPSSKERDHRGQKRTSDETEQVHSANEWENADLGDDSRKTKFLRLMGAGKKDHHSKIHIGESNVAHHHSRTGAENKEMEKSLEEQFVHGTEYTTPYHSGLGYHESSPEVEEKSSSSPAKTKKEPAEKSSSSDDPGKARSGGGDIAGHSYNQWEKADLGDTDRKSKFMRLMGASKAKGKSDSSSSSKKPDSSASKTDLEDKLEEQYQQGLELKLSGAARRHKGLGYVEPPPAEEKPESEEKQPDNSDREGTASKDMTNPTDRPHSYSGNRTHDNRHTQQVDYGAKQHYPSNQNYQSYNTSPRQYSHQPYSNQPASYAQPQGQYPVQNFAFGPPPPPPPPPPQDSSWQQQHYPAAGYQGNYTSHGYSSANQPSHGYSSANQQSYGYSANQQSHGYSSSNQQSYGYSSANQQSQQFHRKY